jgi:pimeloyl-ACP methyl ester carboxylesterase
MREPGGSRRSATVVFDNPGTIVRPKLPAVGRNRQEKTVNTLQWQVLRVLAVVLVLSGPTLAEESPREAAKTLAETKPAPAERKEPAKPEAFTVSRDNDAGTVTILVPARNGRIHWRDVAAGLSEAADLNGKAIASLLPRGSFNPASNKAWFTLFGINAAARGKATLRLASLDRGENADAKHSLKIIVKQSVFRDAKSKLRNRLSSDDERWGLEFDSTELRKPHRKPVIVLVHGYNSRPEKLTDLRAKLRDAGLPDGTDPSPLPPGERVPEGRERGSESTRIVLMFRYPNDGPARKSGEQLASELTRLRKAHPEIEVAVVAHSLGGLVARTAIEDPKLDPGNVRQLIMVATPNQGSHLAYLPGGFDVLEHLAKRDPNAGRFKASWSDGLNEARSDLRPDSKFLRELNARKRNPNVRYSLILGNDAALSEGSVGELTRLLKLAQQKSKTLQIVSPRLDPILTDPREFTRGKGDGVVAVERGRLSGVKDTIVLPFRHNAITGKLTSEVELSLLRAIEKRLEAE